MTDTKISAELAEAAFQIFAHINGQEKATAIRDRWEAIKDEPQCAKYHAAATAALASRHQEPVNEPADPVGHYFGQSVDNWGALEWFDRLVSAISDQDRAVVEGNDIRFETYRAIAASSAMRLVRDFEAVVRSALSPSTSEGEADRCFICDQPFRPGDMVLQDVTEGLGHRACFGNDREAFVKDVDTGEPLGPDDPLPTGWPYEPEAPQPAPVVPVPVTTERAALERIAAIKYPKLGTVYALRATIDYARDQAATALQTKQES